MAELAVTALGADQPGIIARVTGVLLDHGGNLEDSSMTILGGHFAIMLLVSTDADPRALEQALAEATGDLGLVVSVREVGAGAHSAPPSHVLSVYGSDRPGLVHGVSTVLAQRGVNVTDLNTRVLEGEGAVYAMVFEISLPGDVAAEQLADAVATAVPGTDVSIHPLDADAF
jgi:glycine cleavage system transcriptional repressor